MARTGVSMLTPATVGSRCKAATVASAAGASGALTTSDAGPDSVLRMATTLRAPVWAGYLPQRRRPDLRSGRQPRDFTTRWCRRRAAGGSIRTCDCAHLRGGHLRVPGPLRGVRGGQVSLRRSRSGRRLLVSRGNSTAFTPLSARLLVIIGRAAAGHEPGTPRLRRIRTKFAH